MVDGDGVVGARHGAHGRAGQAAGSSPTRGEEMTNETQQTQVPIPALPRRRDPGYGECAGHPAGPFDPMGQTVYCDGSCTRRTRCVWCGEYEPAGEECGCFGSQDA